MGKLTFVLIDDEIYAIRHLKRLIRSVSPDYQILAAFTDATEALRQCSTLAPDAVFVDIIMPGMSGLEFAEHFHALCPDTRIIILTAYRDFEFAQKSLTVGVSDYWLKNELRVETMKEKLQWLENEIESVRLRRCRKSEEQLMRCLIGESPLRDAFPPAPGREIRYFLIICRHNQVQKAVSELSPMLQSRLSKLQISVTDFLFNVFLGESSAFSLGRLVSDTSDGISQMWERCASELTEESKQFPCCSVIFRGYFSEKEYKNHILYETIQIITNLHCDPQKPLVFLDNRICCYFTHSGELYHYLEETYFSKMQQALDEMNLDIFLSLFDGLTKADYLMVGNQSAIDYTILRITEITADIDESAESGESAEFFQKLQENAKDETIEIILQKVRLHLQQMIGLIKDGKSLSAKIRPIINYINKNYDHDLNVSALAKEFCINGDYLRKLFKSKTGIGLAEYIMQIRIDAAEKLVKTGRYRVYEIAELVGYHSASYFSQTYRKCKGYYPTDPKSQEPTTWAK